MSLEKNITSRKSVKCAIKAIRAATLSILTCYDTQMTEIADTEIKLETNLADSKLSIVFPEGSVDSDDMADIRKILSRYEGKIEIQYFKSCNNQHTKPSPNRLTIQEINNSIRLRVRGLLRERKIRNKVLAPLLGMSIDGLHSKLYRNDQPFSAAQLVLIRDKVLPDVDLNWILTGEYDPDSVKPHVKQMEVQELSMLTQVLKTSKKIKNEKHQQS